MGEEFLSKKNCGYFCKKIKRGLRVSFGNKGRRLFSTKKGGEDFFQLKKAAKTFSTKKRGAKTFFS